MKKKVFAILLCAACILVVYNGVGAGNDTVTDEASEIVARRQYIQLAELLAANSGDMEKAEAVATKTTKEVVAKGGTFLEKQRLVSETVAALMAGVADGTIDLPGHCKSHSRRRQCGFRRAGCCYWYRETCHSCHVAYRGGKYNSRISD